MNLRRVITFTFVLLLAIGVLHATASPAGDTSDYAAADAQILKEIHEHSEAMENLEHLSDAIGARLTGSPQLKQANEWTAEMFRKYGFDKCASRTVDHRALVDTRHGARSHRETCRAPVDHRRCGLVPGHRRHTARAGGV